MKFIFGIPFLNLSGYHFEFLSVLYRFPEAMDLILESYLSEVEDESKQQFVQEFISMSAGSTKHQVF